jgi:hypothetical protein
VRLSGEAGMWCSQCQSDVATEISADGQRLLCTICGEEVRKVFAPSQHPETKSARELLERWSKSELLSSFEAEPAQTSVVSETPAEEVAVASSEPVVRKPNIAAASPAPAASAAAAAEPESEGGADLLPSPRPRERVADSEEAAAARPVKPIHRPGRAARAVEPGFRKSEPSRQFRIDGAHDDHARQHVEIRPEEGQLEEAIERTEHASAWTGRDYRDDKPHAAMRAPHFDLETYAETAGRKPGRQESIFGQLLAYLGVGLLTIGTALVVWGYFGGPAVQRYQSTGWLISTAGQMLLFLGVVTLVSGGMQQTTHEVAQRVEHLGGRMHRIEQSTQELLKGPYFAKDRAGAPSEAARKPGRQSS